VNQDKVKETLKLFNTLSEEDQALIASKLLINRGDVVTFLDLPNPNKLDILIRSKELCPPFRGVYLAKEVYSFKGEPFNTPEDLPSQLKSTWDMIDRLTSQEQVALLQSVTITSDEATEVLQMSKKDVNQLAQRNNIKRVGYGLYLRASVDRWYRERVVPRTIGLSDDELYIQALLAAAEELGQSFSKNNYSAWQKEHPEYPAAETIVLHFGGWNVAMKRANLTPRLERSDSVRIELDIMLSVEGLQLAAQELNTVPTREHYVDWQQKHPDYPSVEEIERIWLTFQRALKKANLENNRHERLKEQRKQESIRSLQLASQHYNGELLKREMYDSWRNENPGHLSSIQIIRLWSGWKSAKENANIQ